MLLYERIKEIERYQSVPYDFPKNDKVLQYFPYFARFLEYDEVSVRFGIPKLKILICV